MIKGNRENQKKLLEKNLNERVERVERVRTVNQVKVETVTSTPNP